MNYVKKSIGQKSNDYLDPTYFNQTPFCAKESTCNNAQMRKKKLFIHEFSKN